MMLLFSVHGGIRRSRRRVADEARRTPVPFRYGAVPQRDLEPVRVPPGCVGWHGLARTPDHTNSHSHTTVNARVCNLVVLVALGRGTAIHRRQGRWCGGSSVPARVPSRVVPSRHVMYPLDTAEGVARTVSLSFLPFRWVGIRYRGWLCRRGDSCADSVCRGHRNARARSEKGGGRPVGRPDRWTFLLALPPRALTHTLRAPAGVPTPRGPPPRSSPGAPAGPASRSRRRPGGRPGTTWTRGPGARSSGAATGSRARAFPGRNGRRHRRRRRRGLPPPRGVPGRPSLSLSYLRISLPLSSLGSGWFLVRTVPFDSVLFVAGIDPMSRETIVATIKQYYLWKMMMKIKTLSLSLSLSVDREFSLESSSRIGNESSSSCCCHSPYSVRRPSAEEKKDRREENRSNSCSCCCRSGSHRSIRSLSLEHSNNNNIDGVVRRGSFPRVGCRMNRIGRRRPVRSIDSTRPDRPKLPDPNRPTHPGNIDRSIDRSIPPKTPPSRTESE